MVDFPTPPLADDTAITFLTSWILLFSGKPRCIRSCGAVPFRGSPYPHYQITTSSTRPAITYQWILMMQCSHRREQSMLHALARLMGR